MLQLKKHWKSIAGIAALFLFCVSLTLVLLKSDSVNREPILQPGADSTPTPEPTPEPPKELSILLLGYGGGSHDGGLLTDTMMLVRIDPINKSISLISIPRDLWVRLPAEAGNKLVWGKINSIYSLGNDNQKKEATLPTPYDGGTLAKMIVKEVTAISPDYYAAVNFDAFTSGIDTIGPLTVSVPYTFTDQWYPIRGEEQNLCHFTEADLATLSATFKSAELEKQFTCRYELLHFDKGKTVMDGETALKFVRSRHGDVGGSDFGRAQRQQALLDAVKQKVFSLSFIPQILPLAQQVSLDIKSDMSLADVPTLLGRFSDITTYSLHSILLTDANVLKNALSSDRQYILQPREGQGNWSGVQYYVNQELKNATASATPVASPSAAPTSTPSAN